MTGREKVNKFDLVIKSLIKLNSLIPSFLNTYLLILFRHTRGKTGLLIRYILVKNLSKSCGENVSVQPGVYIFNVDKISFGSNISIHPMCYLEGAGGIIIGNNVSIAHGSSILTTNHTWDITDKPIKYNPEIFKEVILEDDVWIGCGCRILSGVVIEKRSIVAAGAVVNKVVKTCSIYGGVPSRLIKKIND